MKIVFFGTSEFACPSLLELNNNREIEVALVVSRPNRKAGRGLKFSSPPVALLAQKLGLPLKQPEELNEIKEILTVISPVVMVSSSYGGWLPNWLLDLCNLGVVNIHPSLLPKHRGAAPIVRAILEGDLITGVSFMVTDNGWDTGKLLKVFEYPILNDLTAGELEKVLAEKSSSKLCDILRSYVSGSLLPVPQVGAESYAKKILPEETIVSWNEKAKIIIKQILAFNPVPGARTFYKGKLLKLYSVKLVNKTGNPGQIISVNPLIVACKDLALQIVELQPQGKRRMFSDDFSNGYRIKEGDVFGDK